jgi:hypothetical protein
VALAHLPATAVLAFTGLCHVRAARGTSLAAISAFFAAVTLCGTFLAAASGTIFATRCSRLAARFRGGGHAAAAILLAAGSSCFATRGFGLILRRSARGSGLCPHADGKQQRNDKSLEFHDVLEFLGLVSETNEDLYWIRGRRQIQGV